MRKELEDKLVLKYPSIFKEIYGDPAKTCMAFGIECGDGWYKLIDEACDKVSKICDFNEIDFTALQVKEKFGGLRFYYDLNFKKQAISTELENYFRKMLFKKRLGKLYWNITKLRSFIYKTSEEKIREAISKAEALSYETCEICGNKGIIRNGGWIVTLCDEHAKKD